MNPEDVIAAALSTEELGRMTGADDAWFEQARRHARDDATNVLAALTAAGYGIVLRNPCRCGCDSCGDQRRYG